VSNSSREPLDERANFDLLTGLAIIALAVLFPLSVKTASSDANLARAEERDRCEVQRYYRLAQRRLERDVAPRAAEPACPTPGGSARLMR
jgi:hypothetical protein